jgi:hypothetical protein
MRVRSQDKSPWRFHSWPSRSSHSQECAVPSLKTKYKIKIRMLIISVHRLRVS